MRSTKGIKIDSAVAKEGGLQWNKVGDRTFRLIDAKNGVTLGCKLIPKLLKINLRLDNDTIYFTILGEEAEFQINILCLKTRKSEPTDCGDEAASWFSSFVGKECRLIFNRDGMPNAARYGTDRWRFQDSNPFHLLSTDSVDAINKAVPDRSYTYDNFRPNIVVKTLNELPWDEDNWSGFLRIGDAKFAMTCQTPRCTVTGIDLQSFTRDSKMEPLKTLKRFRQPKGDALKFTQKKNMQHAMVGISLVLVQSGTIRNGDEIFLTKY